MRVVVTVEARFTRTPDGAVWTSAGCDHRFFSRYLAAFDEVLVVARVREAARPQAGELRVDGPGVGVHPLPYYVGPAQFLLRRSAVAAAARAAVRDGDAVVLRAPSPIGSLVVADLVRRRYPYALEVVGDPYDVFARGAIRHPARPLIRRWSVARLRAQCARAAAVSYVTKEYLQARYPAAAMARTAVYSSVELGPEAFAAAPRPPRTTRTAVLVSVGSLAQPYKGVDTLVEAVARLSAAGRSVRLVHLGDGRCRDWLADLASRFGVADLVSFAGHVPAGAPVRRYLDAADLFVMPSRTEGLPRALIEAMARGLPAIGTTVGGIPELLGGDCLVQPDDPMALAEAIGDLLADPVAMLTASEQNLDRARDYAADRLTARRTAFYRAVRSIVDSRVTTAGAGVRHEVQRV